MALGTNNPAGPQTPAQDTMQVPQISTGARTRNVINVANPGSAGDTAYTFTGTSDSPTLATDGFVNFRRQRFLHVQVSGSISQGGDGFQMILWGYNTFSGKWGALQTKDPTDSQSFVNTQMSSSHEEPRRYYKFDIDGIEKIAVECTEAVVNGGTKAYVYMGVNSF